MNNKENIYFLTLVEAGSVTKAASTLGITQSSLSKYLIRIEKNFGFEFFIRHSSPLQLSPAGKIYLEFIRESLNQKNTLEQKLKAIEGAPYGEVNIGLTMWRSEALIPDVLPQFLEKYPLVKVRICEGNHKYIYSLLEKKEIDFGVVNLQMHYENLVFEGVKRERILLAVNKNNRSYINNGYAQSKSKGKIIHTDFALFQNEPVILLKPGQHLNYISRNFILANSYTCHTKFETENISTAFRLVEKGLGVSFVPEGLLKTISRTNDVAFFSIGNPTLSWELGVTYPYIPSLSETAALFMNHLKDVIVSKI